MTRHLRRLAIGMSVLLGAGTIVAAGIGPAAAASGFTPGDVVVYRVGDGSTALSGTAAPVFLDEYAPDGTLVTSIPMPTIASGADNPLVASGSASSEGLLTLSSDGRYLIAPGYDTAVGTAKISSSASTAIPRTVARIAADGTVDTSTALTDFATGNNPRSATSTNGTDLWVGGAAGGPRYTTLGATTSTELDSGTFKNVRQVSVVDGQLYASADPTKAGLTIGTVGTGTPETTGQALTNLAFATPPGDPYAYSLLTLGYGTTPDTIYEADLTAGAVVKYGLVDGSWVAEGSVLVASVGGLTANDDNGTVTIYATSSGSSGTAGTLYQLTDDSGVGGTFAGTATAIATLPANEAARGVAFAPGTVIGTGGGIKPPVVKPTIKSARTGLPAALGDPTNPTLPFTIDDANFTADQLDVTATASEESVASDVVVSGSGADRILTVTPGSVGTSTITLTATAPDGTSATAQISYGVSADLHNSTLRYYDGAANASAAIDVGDGYAIVGDDESNVLRLYNLADSGAPVTTYDFTSQLPFGDSEIDIEAAARSGNVIYWEGSMSTSDSGNLAPSRSTVFATQISGSGAATTLTYLGSYTGLLSDLISWDQGNGNALGLADSAASGVSGHASDALNVEGIEFAGSNSDTAYLAFRAPLEPTTDRHLAMLIPVTNFTDLVNSDVHATFGTPIFFDLGGLGIRDIRSNGAGQFLIIAGSADDTNGGFVLYTWDGNPAHAPQKTGTALPQLPSSSNLGAWETIESVPSPLVAGAPIQLLQDDGDVDFYGDGLTSKTGEVTDLQKDLGVVFSYAPPPAPTSTTAGSLTLIPFAGRPVLVAALVLPTKTVPAAVTGVVTVTATNSAGATVYTTTATLPKPLALAAVTIPGSALTTAGKYKISVGYAGDEFYAPSSTSFTVQVLK